MFVHRPEALKPEFDGLSIDADLSIRFRKVTQPTTKDNTIMIENVLASLPRPYDLIHTEGTLDPGNSLYLYRTWCTTAFRDPANWDVFILSRYKADVAKRYPDEGRVVKEMGDLISQTTAAYDAAASTWLHLQRFDVTELDDELPYEFEGESLKEEEVSV